MNSVAEMRADAALLRRQAGVADRERARHKPPGDWRDPANDPRAARDHEVARVESIFRDALLHYAAHLDREADRLQRHDDTTDRAAGGGSHG